MQQHSTIDFFSFFFMHDSLIIFDYNYIMGETRLDVTGQMNYALDLFPTGKVGI